jgi:septal ring factor EnvC (AmiA/AmiB activator)
MDLVKRKELEAAIKKHKETILELEKEILKLEIELSRIHPDNSVDKYLKRYEGQELLKKHSLNEEAIWEVRGEDPNPDLGGHHHQPLLGYFEGTLEKVLLTAVNLDGFYHWGAGGKIIKIEKSLIKKL